MLDTIDEWRETGCFSPLIKRNGMLETVDACSETECFTPLMNGG